MIYFDASATNPMLPAVRDEMFRIINLSVDAKIGNPSSLHTPGSLAKSIMNEARTEVAKLIGVRPQSIIFTSGGTESNNTVINIFKNCPVLVSSIEHPSVLRPAELSTNPFIKIPVDKKGIVDLQFLESKLKMLLDDNPKQKILVSVMLANNEVGTVEPIKAISDIIKKLKSVRKTAKIYLHTDATQAIGKIPVNAEELGVDYMTFTSHKLGGPVGIAALYVKPGSPFEPFIVGGAQENHRRAGTSNVVLASGFGVAAKIAETTPKKYQEIAAIRDYLKEQIQAKIPSARIITPGKTSLPNILNVAFPAAEGESTQLYLDLEQIAVSTGSACASGDLEPSHVLMAMFHDAEVAHGSVRFSLNLSSKKRDIDELMQKLPGIVQKIQDLSTLKRTKE